MRNLLSRLFGHSRRPSGSQSRTPPRRVCPAVDPLEQRLLLDGGGVVGSASPNAALVGGLNDVVGPLPTVFIDPTNPPKNVRDQEMGLPLLDSKPDAPATLYLDFTGNFESDWWNYDDNGNRVHHLNITTPVFDTDGNPASFSADEKALIKEIWSRVAEDYAPFNINVNTDYYGSFNNGQALKVAIGGDNTDWLHQDASGISVIGSFTSSDPNVVFVFNLVAWANAGVTDSEGRPLDGPAAMATTISHEAGHAFGLRHHSLYNVNGDMIDEYDPGTLGWTPIMGNNKAGDRTTWDAGPTDQGPNTFQDDLAIIGGPANGFGFRADDHGNTMATATPLTPSIIALPRLTGKGIINDWRSDVDFFKFTTQGGSFQVEVDAARFGPNLIPVAELWSDHGFVARADAGGFTQSIIHANVPAGTYYVLVKGFGDYGDEGQYTVSVDFGQVLAQALALNVTPPPLTAAAGLKLKAQPIKVKGRWQVLAFDAASGSRRFVTTLPRSLSGRPEISVADLDGDGSDDLLITYRVGKKKCRLSVSGLTGSPLFS
jgi:hypothetical protein